MPVYAQYPSDSILESHDFLSRYASHRTIPSVLQAAARAVEHEAAAEDALWTAEELPNEIIFDLCDRAAATARALSAAVGSGDRPLPPGATHNLRYAASKLRVHRSQGRMEPTVSLINPLLFRLIRSLNT